MSTMGILQSRPQQLDDGTRFYGVCVGVVTNNQDPDGMGRVRVKFPWLSNEDESYWARQATPMAGGDRGVYFLPEVNDEVLCAFDHGDISIPYIIGSLWNGQDAPPESNSDGENNMRTIKSRSGHVIRFDDTSGAEKIIIRDKTESNEIVIDSAENKLTIKIGQEIEIEAGGNISVKSTGGDMTFEANNVSFTAKQDFNVDATGACNVKSTGNCTIEGTSGVEVKSTGTCKVEGTAGCDIKSTASCTVEGTASATLKSTGSCTVEGTGTTTVKCAVAKVALTGPLVSINNGAFDII